ncbi:MAG: ferrous iron transport protein B [Desulfurococcales archaeon]|nr:ferrous iron transport protein B [Desulfurococcales archaeon]
MHKHLKQELKVEMDRDTVRAQGAFKGCEHIAVLIGAPNTGKSTLFTVLTGKSVAIANWPGVTVDIEVGRIRWNGKELCIVDLPGTYGLLPTSPEEGVTRKFLSKVKPEVIVLLLDMSQPEVSLGLILQAVEALPGKVIIAGTKAELAHKMGVHVDLERIQRVFHAPVIRTSALEGVGVKELVDFIAGKRTGGRVHVDYGILEGYIERLIRHPQMEIAERRLGFSGRWIALDLLSGHDIAYRELEEEGLLELAEEARALREDFIRRHGIDPEHLIIEKRIQFIEEVAKHSIIRREPASTAWQKIADLHMHPILGPIVSTVGLLLTFAAVFSVNIGFPLNIMLEHIGYTRAAELLTNYSLSGLLTTLFDYLADKTAELLPGLIGDLIGHGIIAGVGFVLSFTPLVAMVYLSLAILEDSGIAARMAVSFHNLFKPFGLSGRSVFPLVMGLGCNVPAVLSARALSEVERFRAAFAVPFIPCQARLAVIVAFTSVFVKGVLAQSATVVLIYLEALAAALLTSLVAAYVVQPLVYGRKCLPVERKIELIMEIPPVHRPHPRVVWWSVRDNTIHFLRKAGTVIFALAIILWVIFSFGPQGEATTIEDSYAYILGKAGAIVLKPFHMEEWTARILGTGLISGLIAKEGVLSTLAIAAGSGGGDITAALRSLNLTFPQTVGFLVFTSLYFPCIATLAVMVTVLKSKKLVLSYAVYSITLALLMGLATYYALNLALT